MTSKLTREQLHERARENVKALKLASRQTAFESAREEILADLQLAELALAAMDSEPVKRFNADQMHRICLEANRHLDKYGEMAKEVNKLLGRIPAQPAPVIQPVMFIDGDISSEDADKLAKVIREFNEEDERPLAKMARIISENPHPTNECDMPKAQPAPVVQCPYPCGWDNLNKLAIQDAAFVAIALVEGEPAKESIRQAAITNNDRLLKVISACRAACRAAMLAAAPQSPGSEPATVPGKWIPVSERMPDNTEPVLCIEKRADFGTYGQPFVCWHDGGGWVGKTNYRPIVTHWMPLPAAPQEVK